MCVMCGVSGTEILSAHGMPVDLLDRLMIIKTQTYNVQEIKQVMGSHSATAPHRYAAAAHSAVPPSVCVCCFEVIIKFEITTQRV